MKRHRDGGRGEPGWPAPPRGTASADGTGAPPRPASAPSGPGGGGFIGVLAREWGRGWLPGLVLVLATVLVYQPAWRGGFIWDDDTHVANNRMLVEPGGLRQIWSSPNALQYYPLVFTSFRLERALWGLNTAGYHWVNLLLHAASAWLLWRVLRRLSVPGAWLAAAVFAVHPVNVESVAWISQRKNTLAMFFCLLSLLFYVRFDLASSRVKVTPRSKAGKPGEAPGVAGYASSSAPSALFYWLSVGAFVLALLSKTAVAPLPLVLLGLAWWQRGKVTGRDARRSVPFFAAALVLGLMTLWFERHQMAGFNVVRDDSFGSRLAGAGWAVWFYLGKALLPLDLVPIYPRWQVAPAVVRSYIPGALLVAGLLLLWWRRRRWGRVWLFCAGCYVALLLPVLGFVNIGFMRFSLVADHWQYFAIIAPVALACAGIELAVRRGKSVLRPIVMGALFLALGGLAWRQSAGYTNSETFWRAVLTGNPGSVQGHFILGDYLAERGRLDEAIAQYEGALKVQLDPAHGPDVAGLATSRADRLDFGTAREAAIHSNLADALRQEGRLAEALDHYRKALETQPDLAGANCNLGAILLQQGQVDGAIAQFQRALQMRLTLYQAPLCAHAGRAQIHYLLGCALERQGRLVEAMTHYREALRLQPDLAEAHYQLALALQARGEVEEASQHFREAARLKPHIP